MGKAYLVTCFRDIRDMEAVGHYAKLAVHSNEVNGGRILARGMPAQVYEQGIQERLVIVEYDSVEHAIAARDSQEYQDALAALGNAVDRDVRIVEGV